MKKKRRKYFGNLPKYRIFKLKPFIFLILSVFYFGQLFGQRDNPKITFNFQRAPFFKVIENIRQQIPYEFVFNSEDVRSLNNITLSLKEVTLQQALDALLEGSGMEYVIEQKTVVIKKKVNSPSEKSKSILLKGFVTDRQKHPLPGVTVKLADMMLGTSTNHKGYFSIQLPLERGTLEFSFIGYVSQKVNFTERTTDTLRIVMEELIVGMEEVVVTGYQKVDKRRSTSAITSVKASDVLVPGMSSIDQALEGRIPELMLITNSGEVGATPRIRVRGTSTLIDNREPLWVLDGFIMHDPVNVSVEDLNNPDYINIVGNAIAGINPQDIDRIDVLKDASATALYGTKAANGVIVVTTKKGSIGPARFSYNHTSKLTRRPRYSDRSINLMDSRERVQFGKELSDLHYQFPSNMPKVGYEGALYRYYSGLTDYAGFKQEVLRYETVNTDWFDILTQDAYSHDHTFGVSGGSESMRYYVSLGANFEDGVSKTTKTERYTAMVNLDINFSPKIRANFSLNGNIQRKNHLMPDIDAMDYAYNTSRAIPCYDEDGSLFYYDAIGYGGSNVSHKQFRYNILNEIRNSSNDYRGSTLGANLTLRYNILEDLELSVAGNYMHSSTLQEQWWGEKSHYIARLKNAEYEELGKTGDAGNCILPYGGILNTNNSEQDSYTFRTQVEFRKMFGENRQHLASVMGGFELNGSTSRSIADENRGFVKERGLQFIDNVNLEDYPHYQTWINKNHRSLLHGINHEISGYLTLSYSYKDYFTLNANGRFDASNKFGSRSNEKFLPIWSVSGMWNLKETFMKHADFISNMRLRTSYGIQGNMLEDQSPNLILRQGTINPMYNENISTVARYPNPNLKWEETRQFNVELDLSFLDNRIGINGTLYLKKTEDCFTTVQVSSVNGVPGHSYVMNGGNLENNGYSVGLSGVPVKTRDWQWNLYTYFSGNLNKVRSQTVEKYTIDSYLNGTALVDGEAVSSFYSYRFLGLNPANGIPVFNDYADRMHLLEDRELEDIVLMTMEKSGQRDPIFTGSLSTSLTYKSLSLSVNMSYSLGSKVRLFSLYEPILNGVSAEKNIRKEFVNRWMAPGDELNTNVPVILSPSDPDYFSSLVHFSSVTSSDISHIQQFANSVWDMYDKSDIRVVSGNYLKCSSLSLRYTLNTEWLRKTPFSNVQLSLNSMNLFTVSAKALKGQDPSQAGFAKPNLSVRPSYTFQLNVTF